MHQLTFVAPHELVWNEVPEPEIDDPRAALVRPVAVASCDLDAGIVAGSTPLPGPFAFGHEFVADVVEVGDGVRKFAAGQRVVVSFQISCGTCDPCLRGAGGTCTSTTVYFGSGVTIPMLEMYTSGVILTTSRVSARAAIPHVLDLIASGRLHPELVTAQTGRWDDAAELLSHHTHKTVIVRPGLATTDPRTNLV